MLLPELFGLKPYFDLQLKDIVVSLFELWNLMDSPIQYKNSFSKITSILRLSESEITEPGVLSTEVIEQVWMHSQLFFVLLLEIRSSSFSSLSQASTEVERLTKLKATRMKELVLKKRSELEEICKMTHIEPDTSTAAEKSNAMIDSGMIIYFLT